MMGIHRKSTSIDVKQIKELSKLEGEFLVAKTSVMKN
jgi:3-deoxy-7-phosphoheptulonate synthase